MTVKTNKVILKDDTSGYSITRVPNTNLTANRTITEQDRDGTPSMYQDIQDANASKSFYYFGGTTNKGIVVADNDNLSFGNSVYDTPFTGLTVINGWMPGIANLLFAKYSGATDGEYLAYIQNDGTIYFSIVDNAGGSAQLTVTSTVAISQGTHSIMCTYNGSATVSGLKVFVDGILQTVTTNTPSGYVAMHNTANTFVVGNYGNLSGNSFGKSILKQLLINYDLSSVGSFAKIARYSAGAKLDYEDIGGSMMALNGIAADQNFSSDTGFWTKDGGTGTVAIGSNVCTFTNCQSNYGLYKVNFLSVGKKYRITFTINTLTSGAFTIYSGYTVLRRTQNGIDQSISANADSTGIWSFEVTRDVSGGNIGIFAVGTTSGVINDLTFIQLGAVLDLEPENITDTTWFDASPNGLHGTVSGALAQRFVPSYSSRNYIINGTFDFWQRYSSGLTGLTGSSGPGTYIADRWQVLNYFSGTTMAITKQTGVSSVSSFGMKCLFEGTAVNAQRMNIFYTLDNPESRMLAGKTMTLSFGVVAVQNIAKCYITAKYKTTTAAIANISDGTNIGSQIPYTISTTGKRINFTFTVPSLSTLTATGVIGFLIECSKADGSVETAGDGLYIYDVMLNAGPVAAPFERAGGTIGGELALCQTYYEKSFELNTTPAQNLGLTGLSDVRFSTKSGAVATGYGSIHFMVQKRVAPSGNITLYNPNAANAFIYDATAGASYSTTNIGNVTTLGFSLDGTAPAGNAVGNTISIHWTANSEL